MAQWAIKANGNFVLRHTMRPLSVAYIHSPVDINKSDILDAPIDRIWGTAINTPKKNETELKEELEE